MGHLLIIIYFRLCLIKDNAWGLMIKMGSNLNNIWNIILRICGNLANCSLRRRTAFLLLLSLQYFHFYSWIKLQTLCTWMWNGTTVPFDVQTRSISTTYGSDFIALLDQSTWMQSEPATGILFTILLLVLWRRLCKAWEQIRQCRPEKAPICLTVYDKANDTTDLVVWSGIIITILFVWKCSTIERPLARQ